MFFETKKEAAARFPDSPIDGERTDFGDNFSATYNAFRVGRSTWSKENSYRKVLDPILQDIFDKTGTKISNFGAARDEWYSDLNPIDMLHNKRVSKDPISGKYINFFEEGIKEVNNVYKNNPEIFKDQPYLTKEHIHNLAANLAKEAEDNAADIGSRSDSIFGPLAGSGLSEMQDIAQNPILAATMFYGGWNVGIGKFILREALLGAGITAATRPEIAAWRDSVGLEYSVGEAATEVGTAALFSGLFAGTLKTTVNGFKILRRNGVKFTKSQEAEFQKMEMDLEDGNANPFKSDEDVNNIVRDIFKNNTQYDPGKDAAAFTYLGQTYEIKEVKLKNKQKVIEVSVDGTVIPELRSKPYTKPIKDWGIEVQRQIRNIVREKPDPINSIVPDNAHIQNINDATNILLENLTNIANRTDVPPPIKANKNVDEIVENTQPDGHQWFKPNELKVDAKQFQFKEGGDKFGVNERLKGVTKWEQERTGSVIVYERLDGSKVIVDGHQRLALANRIMAQKDGQNPMLSGYIYKEADGFTPEFVMVKAALKNIGEGTGTPVDAAKVLKITPEQAANLPPQSQFVRQAQNLSNLSDEAFRMVNNGLLAPNYAALVGQLVTDQSQHAAIIKLLIDTNPSNITEAESIVRQAMNVEFTPTTNATLFGDETILESLFKERATILDRAIKILNEDKRMFASLNRNKATIEKAGNKLESKVNQNREMNSAAAAQIIQTLANRKGVISDALSQAAKKFKEEGKPDSAAKEFANLVRREFESGNVNGDSLGTPGRTTTIEEEGFEIAASPKQLSDFDDPLNGPGPKNQGDALENQFKDQNKIKEENVEEAFQEDIELRKDLGRVIKEGADLDTIEAHPAVTKAMDEAMSIPVTSEKAGFATDNWWDNRVFKFGDEEVIGDAEGVKRLYDGAKRLAWEDDGKVAPANPIRNNREVTIVLGPPASGKSTIANRIGQATRSMIIDSDEAKKVLPEFEGGKGSNAVHKESQLLSEKMQKIAMSEGRNIIIPTVGKLDTKIDDLMTKYKKAGYKVTLINMDVSPENVMKRMLQRFIDTGKLIPIKVVKEVEDKPIKTYNKLKGKADGYAKIDNNQEFGQDPTVQEIKSNLLQGQDFRLRQSGSGGDSGIPRQPVRQEDLSVDEIPIGERIDPDTGDLVPDYRTPEQILADIKQDKVMLERLEGCV